MFKQYWWLQPWCKQAEGGGIHDGPGSGPNAPSEHSQGPTKLLKNPFSASSAGLDHWGKWARFGPRFSQGIRLPERKETKVPLRKMQCQLWRYPESGTNQKRSKVLAFGRNESQTWDSHKLMCAELANLTSRRKPLPNLRKKSVDFLHRTPPPGAS